MISRCQWGAKPLRGTPIPLSLPLHFLYVHHTYEPSSPCLSFSDCSRSMRSMQKFHQEERGWNDIGYRLVTTVWHLGKCANLLSCWESEEKFWNGFMSMHSIESIPADIVSKARYTLDKLWVHISHIKTNNIVHHTPMDSSESPIHLLKVLHGGVQRTWKGPTQTWGGHTNSPQKTFRESGIWTWDLLTVRQQP